jgi:hypothetical protein
MMTKRQIWRIVREFTTGWYLLVMVIGWVIPKGVS